MNDFNLSMNFTARAQRALQLASREADRFNHSYIGTEHILLGLCALGEGLAVQILQDMDVTLEDIRMEVERVIGFGGDMKTKGELPYTPRSQKVLQLAIADARSQQLQLAGTEHLLVAILREGENVASNVLMALDVHLDAVLEALSRYNPKNGNPQEESEMDEPDTSPPHDSNEEETDGEPTGHEKTSGKTGKGKTPALNAFGRDLTALAKKDELDPVIGRKKELERVIEILLRRSKNNVALIGEAGVGKTAVAEGLARAIAAGEVPEELRKYRVIAIDMALMVAGTKYRGQFEERIKSVLQEVKREKNIILFIDEMHGIVGAGGAEGAMDAANIIKPALARGELQCIGATTLAEYRRFIEKDAALERRFQTVKVDEPSKDETLQILQGIAARYEKHHHVSYEPEALEAAVRLTARYMPGRQLPDKAIDAMDEAGAALRVNTAGRPDGIKQAESRIAELKRAKTEAIERQQFEEAARLRDEECEEEDRLEKLLAQWHEKQKNDIKPVSAETVARVIARNTGIPLERLSSDEAARLLKMEEELDAKVVGQHEAIATVARSLRRARAGLKDPNRPIGSFLFLGPTGVGKTLLAKTVAAQLFGSEDALIQIDMSEYMDRFNVSRLVGSPPGYVGHEEGGQLTEKVRRRPYSVVLFDEVEKAHPDVLHTLLQVLEEGRLTDGLGRKVDFRNTVIILTSNLGFGESDGRGLGFAGQQSEKEDYEHLCSRMTGMAKQVFKPELLNRFDDIVVFRKLTRADIEKILVLELEGVVGRLKEKGCTLSFAQSAIDYLIGRDSDLAMGARPLRRIVERHVEDALAEKILSGEKLGAHLEARANKDNSALEFKPIRKKTK
jgi:ATP-dependent Clp protease ATP-binding subunit ClpC